MPTSWSLKPLTSAEVEAIASYYVPFNLADLPPGCHPDGPEAGAATKLAESIHPYRGVRFSKRSGPPSSIYRSGNFYTDDIGLKWSPGDPSSHAGRSRTGGWDTPPLSPLTAVSF